MLVIHIFHDKVSSPSKRLGFNGCYIPVYSIYMFQGNVHKDEIVKSLTPDRGQINKGQQE